MTHARPLVLAAVVLALLCRLAFAFGYWTGKPLTRDEREYLDLARRAATDYSLSYEDPADRFSRAPLYPLFLAAVLRAAGDHERTFESTPASVKIAQSVVGALAVWIIAVLARRYAGPRGGDAAALIAAIYPPFVVLSGYAFSETLYIAVALMSVEAFQRAVERRDRSPRWPLVAGLSSGLAALTRPAHVIVVACGGLWLAWRRALAAGAIVAGAALLTIAPWTARNYRTYGRLIPIAAEGGVTFWTGNHPLAIGEGDLAANPQLKVAEVEFRRMHPDLSAEALEPLYYRAALAWIRDHPADWLALVARKFFYFWVPIGPSYRLHSTRYLMASALPYLALLPLAAAGAWRLRRRGVVPHALVLYVASGLLTGLIFMPQERFRIPVVDPALVVCAAVAVAPKRGQETFSAEPA